MWPCSCTFSLSTKRMSQLSPKLVMQKFPKVARQLYLSQRAIFVYGLWLGRKVWFWLSLKPCDMLRWDFKLKMIISKHGGFNTQATYNTRLVLYDLVPIGCSSDVKVRMTVIIEAENWKCVVYQGHRHPGLHHWGSVMFSDSKHCVIVVYKGLSQKLDGFWHFDWKMAQREV